MLNALEFNLTVPSALNFLQRFTRLAGVQQGDITWHLSNYFMELTLQVYVFLNYPPSHIAGAALYLAMQTTAALNGQHASQPWSLQLQQQIDLTPSQIAPALGEMWKVVELQQSGQAKYKAVKKKYSLAKFLEVAKYNAKNPML